MEEGGLRLRRCRGRFETLLKMSDGPHFPIPFRFLFARSRGEHISSRKSPKAANCHTAISTRFRNKQARGEKEEKRREQGKCFLSLYTERKRR